MQVAAGEERPLAHGARGVNHDATRVENLPEALAALDKPARRFARERTAARHDRGEVLRAKTEVLLERTVQVRAEPLVREDPAGGQDERHRHREGDGHADPYRQPAHQPSRRR